MSEFELIFRKILKNFGLVIWKTEDLKKDKTEYNCAAVGQWSPGGLENHFPCGYVGSIPASGVFLESQIQNKRLENYFN